MKRCPRCQQEKAVEEFPPNKARKGGVQQYCAPCIKTYNREYRHARKDIIKAQRTQHYAKNSDKLRAIARDYYWQHREERIAAVRAYYEKNTEKAQASMRRRNYDLKIDTLAAYGGSQCLCCGEAAHAFLTIDHINGCGLELRKKHGMGTSFYSWLKRGGYPEGFQVLCWNCNCGRRVNGGICPHKDSSHGPR